MTEPGPFPDCSAEPMPGASDLPPAAYRSEALRVESRKPKASAALPWKYQHFCHALTRRIDPSSNIISCAQGVFGPPGVAGSMKRTDRISADAERARTPARAAGRTHPRLDADRG